MIEKVGCTVGRRFSILDLLLFIFLLTILLEWNRAEVEQPAFDDLFLVYQPPEVPDQFRDHLRNPPRDPLGIKRGRRYSSGSHFFRIHHFEEWRAVVIKFINNRSYWRELVLVQPELSELPINRWVDGHGLYARCRGQQDAIAQLDALITSLGESQLRHRLKSIPWYRSYLSFALPACLAMIWIVLVFVRITTVGKQSETQ